MQNATLSGGRFWDCKQADASQGDRERQHQTIGSVSGW